MNNFICTPQFTNDIDDATHSETDAKCLHPCQDGKYREMTFRYCKSADYSTWKLYGNVELTYNLDYLDDTGKIAAGSKFLCLAVDHFTGNFFFLGLQKAKEDDLKSETANNSKREKYTDGDSACGERIVFARKEKLAYLVHSIPDKEMDPFREVLATLIKLFPSLN